MQNYSNEGNWWWQIMILEKYEKDWVDWNGIDEEDANDLHAYPPVVIIRVDAKLFKSKKLHDSCTIIPSHRAKGKTFSSHWVALSPSRKFSFQNGVICRCLPALLNRNARAQKKVLSWWLSLHFFPFLWMQTNRRWVEYVLVILHKSDKYFHRGNGEE